MCMDYRVGGVMLASEKDVDMMNTDMMNKH